MTITLMFFVIILLITVGVMMAMTGRLWVGFLLYLTGLFFTIVLASHQHFSAFA